MCPIQKVMVYNKIAWYLSKVMGLNQATSSTLHSDHKAIDINDLKSGNVWVWIFLLTSSRPSAPLPEKIVLLNMLPQILGQTFKYKKNKLIKLKESLDKWYLNEYLIPKKGQLKLLNNILECAYFFNSLYQFCCIYK